MRVVDAAGSREDDLLRLIRPTVVPGKRRANPATAPVGRPRGSAARDHQDAIGSQEAAEVGDLGLQAGNDGLGERLERLHRHGQPAAPALLPPGPGDAAVVPDSGELAWRLTLSARPA